MRVATGDGKRNVTTWTLEVTVGQLLIGRRRLIPREGRIVTRDSPIVVRDILYGRQMSEST